MLRISKLADYAIVLMTIFARQPAQLFSASGIAEQANLQTPTVSKLLKKMQKNGLLQAVRGASGGYRLAKPARQISLADVITAIEGQPGLTECSVVQGQCEQQGCCAVQANWKIINRVLLSALQSVTIEEMSQPLNEHALLTKGLKMHSTKEVVLERYYAG